MRRGTSRVGFAEAAAVTGERCRNLLTCTGMQMIINATTHLVRGSTQPAGKPLASNGDPRQERASFMDLSQADQVA